MRPGGTLVVTRLDRLGRNLHETVTTIADLAERDINVQVLDPALDTSRPADKVVVGGVIGCEQFSWLSGVGCGLSSAFECVGPGCGRCWAGVWVVRRASPGSSAGPRQ